MNTIDRAPPPVGGLVDADGRLVQADAPLAELNARAGGTIGATLAVPQIARLVWLARRLRILVSRSVSVADGEDDLDLWVRAAPDGPNVSLKITGWNFRTAWAPPHHGFAVAGFVGESADDLWETDAALRLTFLSEATATQFGVNAADLLGQPITRLFALEDAADGDLPILAAAASHSRFEGQRATVRGSDHHVVLDGAPRPDAAGRFGGFIGAVRTAEPSAPTTAVVPEAFGARLDQALRASLNRIVANADSINGQASGPLRPEYAGYAADIANAGRHLIGLVDDLIDLQSIEDTNFATEREPLDLADIARRAAGLLAVRAEAQQVVIDAPGASDTVPATGEFRRALQVVVNLIGNAVRYSPANGTVWVRVEREGDTAAVIVADQGKGVAAADQTRIFDKFERVDPAEPGGSGLGLYISRRLARAMGGDLTVDSAPGEGARFVFTLPVS